MTQPQKKEEKCEHKNKRRWMMDLESGISCDDCGADLSLKLSVSQQQLSVRERAREIFEKEVWDIFCDIILNQGDELAKKYLWKHIDQIITLAQEEKIKDIVDIIDNCPEKHVITSRDYRKAKSEIKTLILKQ